MAAPDKTTDKSAALNPCDAALALIELYRVTSDAKYLDAARVAGDSIVAQLAPTPQATPAKE